MKVAAFIQPKIEKEKFNKMTDISYKFHFIQDLKNHTVSMDCHDFFKKTEKLTDCLTYLLLTDWMTD